MNQVSQQRSSPQMGSLTAKFYQTFKEQILVPLKLLGSIEQELSLPEYFYEASTTPIAKAAKDTRKPKISIPDEHKCRISQIESQQHIKIIICHNQVKLISGMQRRLNIHKLIHKSIHKSYQQNEKKNHVITSVDTERTLSKAPHSSW